MFCKLAVKAYGGTVRVESTPGEGITFPFTIPVVAARRVKSYGVAAVGHWTVELGGSWAGDCAAT